ncbi:MAG: hypothetical protein DLM72_17845 [Candidatus Nitrosopolaris wilkensis]|nr:MAG: hypothetical protein DLM72_17845 [Candidatus Nitrosopolaris wilkensis]
MLGNEIKKKLSERNWVDISKHDSNPTQTWHRLRRKAHRALDDLILLAKKLPDDKQQEIFDDKIKELFSSMLGITNNLEEMMYTPNLEYRARNKLDYRRTNLAALVVKEGLLYCIYQHSLLFRDTPTLSEPTVEQLERSMGICNELAYKLHMIDVEEDAREENLTYLFEWSEINGKHKERFREFLGWMTGSISLDILDVEFANKMHTITCNLISDVQRTWTALMVRNSENTIATLSIADDHGKELYRFQMLIKEELDWLLGTRFHRFHLYFKDNRSAKEKRRWANKPPRSTRGRRFV